MPLDFFQPAVRAWFEQSFAAPTPAQADSWPAVKAGRDVLIAAPTGSGKTLAAFLCAIDDLVRQGVEQELKSETQIVYVSPLKVSRLASRPARRRPRLILEARLYRASFFSVGRSFI